MATSTDMNWEESLTAHWMSNASRAGVILSPVFPSLKTARAIGTEDTSSGFAVNALHSSSSTLSEDSLHGEYALGSCSPGEGALDVAGTHLPVTLSKEEQRLVVKDSPAQWEALQAALGRDEDLDDECYSDPLLQKLEQLKGLQQYKQEQLKKQQMEQIQRLMEEQQKLLSLVSERQAHTGFSVTDDDESQRYGQVARLSPGPDFPPYRCGDGASRVSSPAGPWNSLQKFSNDQTLKANLSVGPCEKQSLSVFSKMQNEVKDEDPIVTSSGKNSWSPEQTPARNAEHGNSCEGTGDAGTSECLTGRKCLEPLVAEERPIPASVQVKKQSFEEFLEEQIRLEEERLSQKGSLKDTGKLAFQKPLAKRPFLKRGEGLTRFTNAKSKVGKQKESKVTSQPNTLEINNKTDKPQLHRKTAPLNKEHIPDSFVSNKSHRVAKAKKGLTLSVQKSVLRSCTGKGCSPATRQNPSEKKLGPLRESARSVINDDKENIMEFPKSSEDSNHLQSEAELTKGLCHPKCFTNGSVENPEHSFELSFQKKLENWNSDKEKEKVELDEFLFLEQAADEISFASNSSLIIRILDEGRQISTERRRSSTPVKSEQQQPQTNMLDVTGRTDSELCISQQANSEKERSRVTGYQATGVTKDRLNKVDCRMLPVFSAQFQESGNAGWDESESDGSSDLTSESEEEFETTIKPASEEAKMLTLNNRGDSPGFSECKEPAKDKSRGVKLDLLEKVFSSNQSSEIITNETAESQSVCSANRNKIEFDDERSWSEFEENESQSTQVPCSDEMIQVPLSADYSASSETVSMDKAIKRKVATVKRGDGMPKQSAMDSEITAPPATDLMLKLFPSLKPKQRVDAQQRNDTKPHVGQEEPAGDTARSQILREKLVELEIEIEKFRTENASLTKIREEHETALEKLRKETAEFEQQKTKELAQIEEFKKEETRKLQKERKVFEKYALAARAIPDKKERDEIQALKQQLANFQEDLKRREAKWSTTHVRLRDQIEALTKENTQLREEIKIMERFRLEAWKRKEASTKRKADGYVTYPKRVEYTHSTNVLQKNQAVSSVPQAEKSRKANGKSNLLSEERHFTRPRRAAAHGEGYSDNVATAFDDSSKTFIVNTPGNGTVEPLTAAQHGCADSEEEVEREASYPDGKVEKILKNGCHLILFPNGTRKEVSCDGKTVTVTFFNGDVKQVLEDQSVVYYYADAKTTHTTYPTGLEVLHFSSGQIEKHFPDGRKEIVFPDETIKNVFTDGREENIFPDGTIVRVQPDGSKVIEFNDGQQELHTAHFKRREYPDGTVKTVYADGHQETKYASGRVRIKDKDGKIIMDSVP